MSRPNRVVRTARAADVDDVVTLRAVMFEAMGTAGVEGRAWQQAARRWFLDRLDVPTVRVVVVEVDGVVVATATGTRRDAIPSPVAPAGTDVLLSSVATLPGYRRQGHSRAAVTEVLAWARTTGAGRADLVATDDGAGLYRQLGFARTAYPLMQRLLP